MFAPEGRFIQVPTSDAGTLAAAGFRADTPELRAQLAAQEKFGGLGGEIATAGLGLASGLTLGLSKPVLRGAGVPVDELEQANPDAFTAGEVGSFLVPALGQVKALGTAGKAVGALGAAQLGISKVGDVARKLVAKNLGAVGQSAVKMGAEGVAFGAANAVAHVADDWVQNKDLQAEALLAHAGSTAAAGLLGAGLGALFPIVGKLGRKAADKVGEQATQFFDPQRSRQLFTGAMQKELREDTGHRFQQAVEELSECFYKGGAVDLDTASGRIIQTAKGALPDVEEVLVRRKDLLAKAGNAIGEKLAAADAAAGQAGYAIPSAAQWGTAEAKQAAEKILAWRKTRAITDVEVEGMKEIVKDVASGVAEAGGKLKDLHALRRGLDARIGGKNWESLKSEQIELVKDLRGILSGKIESAMGELEQAGIVADGGAWKRLNRLYSNLKTIESPLNRAHGRANANVNVGGLRWRDMLAGMGGSAVGGAMGGPVGAALGTLTGVANKVMQTDRGLLLRAEIGDWINKNAANTGKALTSAAQKMLVPVGQAAERESLLVASKLSQEWFAPLQARLADVASDPLRAADALYAETNELREAEPELADALIQKQMQVYSYLYERMPKAPTSPFNAGKPWKPTPSESQKFAKVVRTAQNPQSIFADVNAGTASREQVQALQALYPSIHTELVRTITESLADVKHSIPYDQQIRLSRILGAPVTKYVQPSFVRRLQSLQSTEPEDEAENSSMGRVKLAAGNMMSDAQRVEARNIR